MPSQAKWAQAVKERANGLCQVCGESGVNAHHIHCAGYYPDEVKSLDNGIYLCRRCHILAHRGRFGTTLHGKYSREKTLELFHERAKCPDSLLNILIDADFDNVHAAEKNPSPGYLAWHNGVPFKGDQYKEA